MDDYNISKRNNKIIDNEGTCAFVNNNNDSVRTAARIGKTICIVSNPSVEIDFILLRNNVRKVIEDGMSASIAFANEALYMGLMETEIHQDQIKITRRGSKLSN